MWLTLNTRATSLEDKHSWCRSSFVSNLLLYGMVKYALILHCNLLWTTETRAASPGTIYTNNWSRTCHLHQDNCINTLSFVSTALPNILFSTLPRELLYCNSLTRYRFFSGSASAAVKEMNQFKPDTSQEQKPEVFPFSPRQLEEHHAMHHYKYLQCSTSWKHREPGKQDLMLAYITEGAAVLTVNEVPKWLQKHRWLEWLN